jgi:hypothetical protein
MIGTPRAVSLYFSGLLLLATTPSQLGTSSGLKYLFYYTYGPQQVAGYAPIMQRLEILRPQRARE